MRRAIISGLVIFLTLNIFCTVSYSSTGGNTGLTGLWEYPTAEMPDDGAGRFGYTHASPYSFYFLDLAWLPWFEINARLTTFDTLNVDYANHIGPDVDGRKYMDKAIDLKAVLWHNKDPQNWIIPSIAFGVVDMMGTELMKAYYGVATWRWGDFAATIGYGDDRFNGVFGGIEWDITEWLTFKAEYSPLDYNYDRVGRHHVVRELPDKKYNAGFVIKAPWGMQGSISYQRGNEWVFTISQRIDLKGPFIGNGRKNYNFPSDTRCPTWDGANQEELISRIKSGIEKYMRVRDVEMKLDDIEDGHRLTLSYENYGYSSHAEAMTRLLVVLASVMPETDELLLIHKNAGIPVVQASFPGTLLFDIRAKSLRDMEDPIHAAVFEWASNDIHEPDDRFLQAKARHELKAMLVYEPRIDQTLAETYMDRLNIDAIYTGRYSNGWGLIADIRFPIYNTVDTKDITGLWWEKDLNDNIRLQQGAFTYANHLGNSGRFWFFGEGGWLDEEWFGANMWLRYYGESGRWWVGLRGAALHDRDPWSFAGLTDGKLTYRYGRVYDVDEGDAWRYVGWLQAGYTFTGIDLDIQADYGKFADDDKGWKISATRHWEDTALGFWYINTDVKASGKDFTKAGIHMELPAEKWFGSWFGNPSAHIWEQDTMILSAWKQHSGRIGGIVRTPERMMSQLRPASLKINVEKLLKEYCSYDDSEIKPHDIKQETSLLEYIFH